MIKSQIIQHGYCQLTDLYDQSQIEKIGQWYHSDIKKPNNMITAPWSSYVITKLDDLFKDFWESPYIFSVEILQNENIKQDILCKHIKSKDLKPVCIGAYIPLVQDYSIKVNNQSYSVKMQDCFLIQGNTTRHVSDLCIKLVTCETSIAKEYFDKYV